ncbi:zf-C3HC4 type zinc finger protein [Cryptococcus neoformans 125.91]|nr:zf-C3HC4 type zinc finger protein [Cryptococcus neoformans var. grubii 125.91]
MGNAPSSHAIPPPSSSTNTASISERERASSSAQPVNTSTAGRIQRPSVSFHSGLTPPTSPPSPPPPSTPPLLPYAGHLSPQNPHCLTHPQAHDYSKSVVTRLILDGKLAPFYRGLEDFEEDWTEEDIGRILTETREKDYAEGVANSYTERSKEEREGGSSIGNVTKKIGIHKSKELRREGEKDERERRERRAYLNAVECPICFLSYPPNINTSRCCQQPVCTECFVQIKRSEPTITHLESEPACCPFCVETDFGVIYERPPTPMSSLSSTALATSPAVAGTSSFGQAFSVGSDAELAVGPGMNPIQKETIRRKSVSSKAKEVVTIDEIRPDWEQKLNSVKAAAARRASRRIIMRQVGDRLVPIGYTSSRAPGTADFSMSVPQIQNGAQSGADESGSNPRRLSRRRGSNREREIEELMIMEAMRLSLLDHEEHQRRQANDCHNNSTTSGVAPSTPPSGTAANASTAVQSPGPPPGPSTGAAFAATVPSTSSSTESPRRLSGQSDKNDKQSGASKLLSKFSNVRARANSAASSKGHGSGDFKNTFGRTRDNSGSIQTLNPSPALVTPSASVSASNSAGSSAVPSPIPSISPLTTSHTQPLNKTSVPAHSSGLSPTISTPAAPITTLASPGASGQNAGEADLLDGCGPITQADAPVGLPHLSADMPTLTPDDPNDRVASTDVVLSESDLGTTLSNSGTAPRPSTLSASSAPTSRAGMHRSHSCITEVTEPEAEGNGPGYAHLDSDEER